MFATTGSDDSSQIGDPGVPVPQEPSTSACAAPGDAMPVQLFAGSGDAPRLLTTMRPSAVAEFCVLPIDATKKQKKRFHECRKKLDCDDWETDFNEDGDQIVTCE